MRSVLERLARLALLALRALLAVVAVVALTGCTLSPGRPWGEITEAGATASFAPPDDRVDDDGRLRTAKDYGVALDVVVATFETLALQQAGGTAAASLDIGDDVGLRNTPTALPLACDSPCLLARGDVVEAQLAMTSLHVRGIAFDVREEGARLPPGGRLFDIVLQPPTDVVAAVSASIERFQAVQWTLDARFELAPGFLDAIDFVDTNEDGTLEQAHLEDAAAAVVADSILDVRFFGDAT